MVASYSKPSVLPFHGRAMGYVGEHYVYPASPERTYERAGKFTSERTNALLVCEHSR